MGFLKQILARLKTYFGPRITLFVIAGKKIDLIHFKTPRHYRNVRHEWQLNAMEDQKRLITSLSTNKPLVIFDIGANIGQTAMTYREHFPDSTIYSFEPFPQSFIQLKESTERYTDILSFQLALSDKSGQATMYISDFSVMNSLRSPNPEYNTGFHSDTNNLAIETVTLDQFCQDHDIHYIDILKIDVQGAELPVLQGAAKMLEEQRIGLIYTELQHRAMYQDQTKYFEVIAFLDNFGYELFNFYNVVYSKKGGQFSWCDAIFINRTFAEKL